MKRNFQILIGAMLFLLMGITATSQAENGKYRLGLQGTQFAGGPSGVIEVGDQWAMQGVLDFGVNSFAFRLLDRFAQRQFWNAYGQGTVGLWHKDEYWKRGWWGDEYHGDTNGVGVGVGLGIEYDWRGMSDSLPPLGWNIELGASIVPGFYLDLGLGVHWKF